MSTASLTGKDSINLNNRGFTDLADGNCVEITFPNDIANVKTGKNGNSIYALNESGRQADLVMRVIRGSSDDKFLQNLLNQQNANFAGTIFLQGEFVKNIGDGSGQIAGDTYILGGGIFSKQIPAKQNTDGDTDQSVATYSMRFSNAPRVIT